MRVARVAIVGALASLVIAIGASGGASAMTGSVGAVPANGRSGGFYVLSRGMVGLGFGFGPWWGPYDSYAPPAYAYPPPVYSVPPPPAPATAAPPPPPGASVGPCRRFESTVIVDGQARVARGLACPQPDGTWRIVR